MVTKIIKTDCILCVSGCGINAHVEDGKLVGVTGMTEHPLNHGKLCASGEAIAEYIYSPDRLQYPLRKVNGKWERLSWDEALDIIAEKLNSGKEEFGAHSLAIFCGSIGVENNELAAFARRFRGAYGTPNFLSVESNCYRARILAQQLTLGTFLLEEPENAKCVILWGTDPGNSKFPLANAITNRVNEGKIELVVINPKRTQLAKKGIHIAIRPGTDCALALSMMNVIISENLYDKEFVEKNTIGFDKLAEHIKQYPPEEVEKITWVPADDIRKIARLYARAESASITPGTCAIDQHVNGLQTGRAFTILQTITGNIDKPGGWASTPFPRLGSMHIKVEEDPIGSTEHPLFYRLWGREAPYGQVMYLADAILDEKPYPIKSMIVTGGNPIMTLPDTKRLTEALKALDFLVVIDMFMTETAELADIVLPASSFAERSGLGYVYAVTSGMPYLLYRKKIIEPLYESKADWEIWTELGRKMGYGDLFPWNSAEEIVEYWLGPSGKTPRELIEDHPEGVFFGEKKYDLGQKGEFRTPSGKIELYSKTLAEYGYDPIPVHVEPSQSPVSNPEMLKEYPLILTTGARQLQYTHTQFRNVPSLRREAPEPLVEIHPDTAREYGISDGDMISVETPKGAIKMKVSLTEDLIQTVVSIPHGWPEANANLLTSLEPRDPITGYTELKALLCKIKKV
ncbi:MAG: molybdopterin-dependent oxidoreductase [Dehalococcoidales bacterium]